ncbi:drug/metabolite transporter (DMT)-like permease [Sphingomonas vulcanisoli]|uniref:Drug/metabolite transporter (DMT)-like permease n=1 Tax=Sphingomonas vulcanisoli TaxID=1658060 RepID=A0ABX0TRR3_9SPHN|nr:DMT family transporter [Sphingomonas vulcanisoli]NIJ06885.1 drug/metabolite transporter (DMT)-like permease [Sphingomonas vulcanisoli]
MAVPLRSARLAIPALLIANFALALGPWLVRLARTQSEVGPIAAGFWRLTLALPILFLAARRMERTRFRFDRAEAVIAIGGLAFAADLATWHIGILHTRLANATLFGNITAVLFPIYGFLIARSWPMPRQWLALGGAAVGVALLLGRSFTLSAEHVWGDLACIFAGLCYTVYLIALDRVRGAVAPVSTLFLSALSGVPLLLIAALAMGEPMIPRDWTPLVALAIGSQIIGQGLIIYAVSRVPPIVIGLMLLVQPIVSATIGWLAYRERLTLADAIGAVAIVAAVVLVRDSRRTPPLPAPEPALERAA